MDKDELRAWLRLSMTEAIGNDAARRLLGCFGSPQAVFEQTEARCAKWPRPNKSKPC
jgi:DNA processing protein